MISPTRCTSFVIALFLGTFALASAPVTLPPDECVTHAEIKEYREPLLHNGNSWMGQTRNRVCTYEIGEVSQDGGDVDIVGNCDHSGHCLTACGTSTTPNHNPKDFKVGLEVKKISKDTWNTTIGVGGEISWGNKESATSLIFGSAEIKITAEWQYEWGGEEATEVTVGKEVNTKLNPCTWLRQYSYGAFRSGAEGDVPVTVTVTWDEFCTIHNKWYNDRSSDLGSGNVTVDVSYMIGTTCSNNLADGSCDGLTLVGLAEAAPCPANDDAVRELCGFESDLD